LFNNNFGKDDKFTKLIVPSVKNVVRRMKRFHHKFKCPVDAPVGSRSGGVCTDIENKLAEIMAWNMQHVADCGDKKGKGARLAGNYNRKLTKSKNIIVKRCAKKLHP